MPTRIDVRIDVLSSWPDDFRRGAIGHHDLVLAYHVEEQRILELYQTDDIARFYPPKNPYRDEYVALVDQLDALLVRHRLVVYHCTRLTVREAASILQAGLRILSDELVHERISQCCTDGHIAPSIREYLENSESVRANLANRNGRRTGMIWFCPNQSTLQKAGQVVRFFRSWGGEAVYVGHEADQHVAHVLANVGVPAIVKCAIPFPCDNSYQPKYTERFLSQLIANEIEFPEPPSSFDLCIKRDVPATQVLGVIKFSDQEFEHLTAYSTWPPNHAVSASSCRQ
jgi:hypothetical protein